MCAHIHTHTHWKKSHTTLEITYTTHIPLEGTFLGLLLNVHVFTLIIHNDQGEVLVLGPVIYLHWHTQSVMKWSFSRRLASTLDTKFFWIFHPCQKSHPTYHRCAQITSTANATKLGLIPFKIQWNMNMSNVAMNICMFGPPLHYSHQREESSIENDTIYTIKTQMQPAIPSGDLYTQVSQWTWAKKKKKRQNA